MKKSLTILLLLLGLYACEKENKEPGNPELNVALSQFVPAHFGDSIPFTANVFDAIVPLSTLKVQLFYGETMVQERVIRTKESGTYSGKIFAPVFANIPDGNATLRLVLQNIHFTSTELSSKQPLSRPTYPYLTLRVGENSHRMDMTSENEYAATDNFDKKVNALIEAPAVGVNGNPITFGWGQGEIVAGSSDNIPFGNSVAGNYTVTFNTLTFLGTPFPKPTFGGMLMQLIESDIYRAELNLSQGDIITVEDVPNYNEFWIDPDYFTRNVNNTLTFKPLSGKYRVTANTNLNYFMVESMTGSSLSTLSDGNAVWVIGYGIGKPSPVKNNINWDTNKALCMAKIGEHTFAITLQVLPWDVDNKYDFKLFHQKGWGGEFTGANYLSVPAEVVMSSSGNISGEEGNTLNPTKWYTFTLDLSQGADKAGLTVAVVP